MKLQYHKIRGVDKSVCTAEQKIAYNMASRIYGDIRFAKAWQQYDSGKVPAFLQNDWESKAIREYFTTWQRDYYSWEGYEALLAYYNDIDPNMELDAVAICGDCTEYGEGACCSFDDLINDKGYAYPIEDYKADNDIETDDEFDQDDYIVALAKKLEQRTTVLHVSNGNYIIFA